jgi:hypothetical protein
VATIESIAAYGTKTSPGPFDRYSVRVLPHGMFMRLVNLSLAAIAVSTLGVALAFACALDAPSRQKLVFRQLIAGPWRTTLTVATAVESTPPIAPTPVTIINATSP